MIKNLFLLIILSISSICWCQVKITGTVTDENTGDELPGVIIAEIGTDNSTKTDIDGHFIINVNDSTSILTFAFVGYIDREVSLKGRTIINIPIKEYGIYEAWDQKIAFYIKSGIINNPVGGQFEFSIPAFHDKLGIKSGISYQTNLKENHILNFGLGLHHIRIGSKGVGLDIESNYRNILSVNIINLEALSVETTWWFRFPMKVIAGYSHLDLEQNELTDNHHNSGFVIGTEIWVPKPISSDIMGKVSIYENATEYQAEIQRAFKRIQTFARYYHVNSFSEFSVGIGIEFTYFFKYQRNEYPTEY